MDGINLETGGESLINKIVDEYMSSGKFDQLRRMLVSDVDTKAAYQNTKRTMHHAVRNYLNTQNWRLTPNKNQLRDNLRKHLLASKFIRPGVARVVDQAVGDAVMRDVRSEVQAIADNILGINKEGPMETEEVEPSCSTTEIQFEQPNTENQVPLEVKQEIKVEPQSEEPMQVYGDIGVPGEGIIELKRSPAPLPLEEPPPRPPVPPEEPMAIEDIAYNEEEQEMSEDESEHSITNQMSPISFGSPSPPHPEPEPEPEPEPLPPNQPEAESEANTHFGLIKRASDFVGKIPKLKRSDNVKDSSEVSDAKDNISKKDGSSKHKNGVRDERKNEKERDRRDGKSDRSSDRAKERDRSKTSDKSTSISKSKDREESSRDKERSRDRDRSSDKSKSKDSDKNLEKDRSKSNTRNNEGESSRKIRAKEKLSKIDNEKSSVDNVDDKSSGDSITDNEQQKNTDKSKEKSSKSEKTKGKDKSTAKSSASQSISRESRSSTRASSRR